MVMGLETGAEAAGVASEKAAAVQRKEGSGGVSTDYVTRVFSSPAQIDAQAWQALLGQESDPSPFVQHAYLLALHETGCARAQAGWQPQFLTLWRGEVLHAAAPLYLKNHSYGEYVFDWAWANAYAQHGLDYYPKAVVAVPFTPVPGARLLARDATARAALTAALIDQARSEGLSSLHLLFVQPQDLAVCEQAGMMLRQTVQFHWKNVAPTLPAARGALPPEGAASPGGGPAASPVAPALPAARGALPPEGAASPWGGPAASPVAPTLPAARGALPPEGAASPWGGPAANPVVPTLPAARGALPPEGAASPGGGPAASPVAPALPAASGRFTDFDHFLASLVQEKRKKIRQERRKVAEAGVVFRHAEGAEISEADWDFFYRCYERTYLEHGNAPYLSRAFFLRMASDMPQNWLMFIAEREGRPMASSLIALDAARRVAYGRYWGALERVDCLHFEACYYQPLAWCIAQGIERFEGGAQGEQKMARALLPVKTTSAHWLAQPAFADAVGRFLEREQQGVGQYLAHLSSRNPFKAPREEPLG
jgi:predicted N-acyltransferase